MSETPEVGRYTLVPRVGDGSRVRRYSLARSRRGPGRTDSVTLANRRRTARTYYVIVYVPRVAYDHEPMLRFASEVIPQFS